jgi:hypothetical protein
MTAEHGRSSSLQVLWQRLLRLAGLTCLLAAHRAAPQHCNQPGLWQLASYVTCRPPSIVTACRWAGGGAGQAAGAQRGTGAGTHG